MCLSMHNSQVFKMRVCLFKVLTRQRRTNIKPDRPDKLACIRYGRFISIINAQKKTTVRLKFFIKS